LLRPPTSVTEPDVVILSVKNWDTIRLAKTTGSGDYLLGSPSAATALNMWGIPVVLTRQMPANTGIVANLSLAATAFVWQAPTLEVAPMGGGANEFIANQTLVRAEERLALATQRPTAIVKLTGLN